MPWNFLHWSWCYCRYTIFVLQSYLFYNPALLSHFTSYQTGFYIAARWYFSLNHWTSQRFDHPGHAEKHWRLWLAGINNHWELHPRMQSNNQRRSWQLPALERKKKTIGSISKLLLTESEYFPAFPEWLLQNWVFSWVIIIKLDIFPSLSPLVQPGEAGCSPGHQSTSPWAASGPENSSFSKVCHFLAAKNQWSSGMLVPPQLLP